MKKVELQGEPTEQEIRAEELRRARALLAEERRRTRVPRRLGKLAVAGGLVYGARAIDRNVLKRWGGDRIVRVPGSDRLQSIGGGRRAAYAGAARHYGSAAVDALRKRMRFDAVQRLTELAKKDPDKLDPEKYPVGVGKGILLPAVIREPLATTIVAKKGYRGKAFVQQGKNILKGMLIPVAATLAGAGLGAAGSGMMAKRSPAFRRGIVAGMKTAGSGLMRKTPTAAKRAAVLGGGAALGGVVGGTVGSVIADLRNVYGPKARDIRRRAIYGKLEDE